MKFYDKDEELERRIAILKKYPPHEFRALENFYEILKDVAPHLVYTQTRQEKDDK